MRKKKLKSTNNTKQVKQSRTDNKLSILEVEAYRLIAQKKYSEAILSLDKYIKQSPNDYSAYCIRALCKKNLLDFRGAISDCNMAINLKPDDATAYTIRSQCKKSLGDHIGSKNDLNYAIILSK